MDIKTIMKEKGIKNIHISRSMNVNYSTVHRWIKDKPEYILELINTQKINKTKLNRLSLYKLEELLTEIDSRGFEINLKTKEKSNGV